MEPEIRLPSFYKDTLANFGYVDKQEPLHQDKVATAQFRGKSDFIV